MPLNILEFLDHITIRCPYNSCGSKNMLRKEQSIHTMHRVTYQTWICKCSWYECQECGAELLEQIEVGSNDHFNPITNYCYNQMVRG
jgi:DNA-directed RNA polymerase subunit RPC12/RpoP